MIMSLALSSAKKKVLFITKDILSKIENGDNFLKDSIHFSSDYCSVISVTDENDIAAAEKILPRKWKNKVSVLSDIDGLNKLLTI